MSRHLITIFTIFGYLIFSLTIGLQTIMFKSILTMLFDKYSDLQDQVVKSIFTMLFDKYADLQDQVGRTYCSRRLLSFSLYNALKLNAPYFSDLFISHD